MNKSSFPLIQYQMLVPAMIKIDKARYQRDLEQIRVNRIVRNWDEAQVNEPKVSMRADGSLWAMDGQHTLAAWMLVNGNQPILCKVYEGLTAEEEARYFEKFNTNNKKPSYGAKLKARYAYGEPKAVAYIDMLHSLGITPNFNENGKGLCCHGMCEEIIRACGLNTLREALLSLDAAYPGSGDRFKTYLIKSMSSFIYVYGSEVNSDRLVKKLSETPIPNLKAAIAGYVGLADSKSRTPAASHMGGATKINLMSALAIVDIYNNGLRIANRLDSTKVLSIKGETQ